MAEPIMEPPACAGLGLLAAGVGSKRVFCDSQGRAEASLPTFSGLYWGKLAGASAV